MIGMRDSQTTDRDPKNACRLPVMAEVDGMTIIATEKLDSFVRKKLMTKMMTVN